MKNNNLDQAIEELIKVRVAEAVEKKDEKIRELEEKNSTLLKGSYSFRIYNEYYGGYGRHDYRYFETGDPEVKEIIDKIVETKRKEIERVFDRRLDEEAYKLQEKNKFAKLSLFRQMFFKYSK